MVVLCNNFFIATCDRRSQVTAGVFSIIGQKMVEAFYLDPEVEAFCCLADAQRTPALDLQVSKAATPSAASVVLRLRLYLPQGQQHREKILAAPCSQTETVVAAQRVRPHEKPRAKLPDLATAQYCSIEQGFHRRLVYHRQEAGKFFRA